MTLPSTMTDEGQALVRHWMELREGTDLVPNSAAFLDQAHPKIQPYISFNDMDDDGNNVITLFGTGLVASWGSDITGLSVRNDFPSEVVSAYEALLRAAATQPCGIWEVSRFATSSGRVITKEITTLPLRMRRPGVIRIARFHRLIESLYDVERVTGLLQSMGRQWFDVGAGVPETMPATRPLTKPLGKPLTHE
ncbi:MAG: hypothetical protein JNM81_04210 [Rhodospirillaceae bacterium]|nr:hypothetical protein [Rhodospirillaceae bacterium]